MNTNTYDPYSWTKEMNETEKAFKKKYFYVATYQEQLHNEHRKIFLKKL